MPDPEHEGSSRIAVTYDMIKSQSRGKISGGFSGEGVAEVQEGLG